MLPSALIVRATSDLLVAILTDPGGSVLPLRVAGHEQVAELVVAILTDPGGSVLPGRGCRRSLGYLWAVAILTDPGGSVLLGRSRSGVLQVMSPLRSSPTPEGRCCR